MFNSDNYWKWIDHSLFPYQDADNIMRLLNMFAVGDFVKIESEVNYCYRSNSLFLIAKSIHNVSNV